MTTTVKDREVLSLLERWLEVIFTIIAMAFVAGFFAAHQVLNTGFFTAEFGAYEMLALYGPMALSLVPPIIRASLGVRNPARPMEAIANTALAVGALWLFFVFPFDVSHLADILPGPVQFVFSWLTDGMARIVLILQVVIGVLTAIGKMGKFISVQSR
ncbi:MAG: hypothetical protein WEA61_07485 [Anaerolineales bacterium]